MISKMNYVIIDNIRKQAEKEGLPEKYEEFESRLVKSKKREK